MPSSQTPALAAIGAAVLGVSLVATGGTAHAVSSVPAPAASYVAEPAEPAPVDVLGGGLVTGVLGSTVSGDVTGDVLKAVDLVIDDLDPTKLPEELLKLNPAQETVEQVMSVLGL